MFWIFVTNLWKTFIGGGSWCISKTCACSSHLGSGCLTSGFSSVLLLPEIHINAGKGHNYLNLFFIFSPVGGSRGWYGGWEESERWRKEESGRDFFRECCNTSFFLWRKTQAFVVWKPSLFWMLTFQFCSTLGIAPFAAAPDIIVSAEEVTLLNVKCNKYWCYTFNIPLAARWVTLAFKILADPPFFGMPGFWKGLLISGLPYQQDTTFGTIFI